MTHMRHSFFIRILCWLPAIVFFLYEPAFAQVVAYPQIPGRALSTTYTVTVGGQTVPVQQYNGKSFAWFAFAGSANVKISVNQSVSSYTLSPTRNQVPSTVSGSDITFTLTQPRKLVLNKVNGLSEQLFIFADALEVTPPVPGQAGVFNVSSYGADPSGVGNSTTAIQQAINAASAQANGGVAYVPAGTYNVTGTISLANNANLYLAPGAVIRPQSGSFSYSTLFAANNVTNAKISGRGIIYGRGSEGSFGASHLLLTNLASNCRIQDVMFLDSVTTAIRLGASTDFTVDNAKVLSASPSLSDGIDLESNTRITLSNNVILSSDDNIAIGSGTNAFQYGVPGPTDTITITGNIFSHPSTGYPAYGHLVSIVPWQGTSYIRNITFNNNDAIWEKDVFSIYPFGGTNVYNVTYSNTGIEEVTGKNFDFWAGDCSSWGAANCGQPMGVVGYIHTIKADTLTIGTFGAAFSQLVGFNSTSDVNGVTFNNVRIAGYLVTSANTGNITIGPYVYNVVYSATADTIPPVAPTGLRVF